MVDSCGMTERYPSLEPYEFGMLSTSDGHDVYWEAVGNPEGTPAVYCTVALEADALMGRAAISTPTRTVRSCSISVAAAAAGRWLMSPST
jgi:hypothetical protein